MLGCALREGRGDSRVVGSCWTSLADLGTVVWVWHRSSPFPFCPVRAKNRSKSFLGIVFLRENPMILGLLSIFCSNPRMGGGGKQSLGSSPLVWVGSTGYSGNGIERSGHQLSSPSQRCRAAQFEGEDKNKKGTWTGILHHFNFRHTQSCTGIFSLPLPLMAAMCGCCFTPLLVLNRKKRTCLLAFPHPCSCLMWFSVSRGKG